MTRAYSPVFQAAAALGGILLVILGAKLVKLTGIIEVPNRFPWMTAAVFMLCFAMFNAIFSLTVKNMVKYWGKSVYSFMGLAVLAGLLAYVFSSMSMSEAGSYRWIFIVVTVSYLVFLSMMALMRNIVEFAQKEEWNQPRFRSRKGGSTQRNDGSGERE